MSEVNDKITYTSLNTLLITHHTCPFCNLYCCIANYSIYFLDGCIQITKSWPCICLENFVCHFKFLIPFMDDMHYIKLFDNGRTTLQYASDFPTSLSQGYYNTFLFIYYSILYYFISYSTYYIFYYIYYCSKYSTN